MIKNVLGKAVSSRETMMKIQHGALTGSSKLGNMSKININVV